MQTYHSLSLPACSASTLTVHGCVLTHLHSQLLNSFLFAFIGKNWACNTPRYLLASPDNQQQCSWHANFPKGNWQKTYINPHTHDWAQHHPPPHSSAVHNDLTCTQLIRAEIRDHEYHSLSNERIGFTSVKILFLTFNLLPAVSLVLIAVKNVLPHIEHVQYITFLQLLSHKLKHTP